MAQEHQHYDKATEMALQQLVAMSGQTRDEVIRDALVSYLDDMEDIAIAEARLASPVAKYSSADARASLDVDD